MVLTAERLRDLLTYEPSTGVFTWRFWRYHMRAGDVAGSLNKKLGCIMIGIDGGLYYAHRLAWLYQTGEWPPQEIDHRDGNPLNNRWANLRLAAHAENVRNARKRRDNKSGLKGVCWSRQHGKWRADINLNHTRHFLGLFDAAEVAHLAYRRAARRLHGEFARMN